MRLGKLPVSSKPKKKKEIKIKTTFNKIQEYSIVLELDRMFFIETSKMRYWHVITA